MYRVISINKENEKRIIEEDIEIERIAINIIKDFRDMICKLFKEESRVYGNSGIVDLYIEYYEEEI